MKRQYKVSEIFDYMQTQSSAYVISNSLIGSYAKLSALYGFIQEITDSEGEQVPTSMYYFIPKLFEFSTEGILASYLDHKYTNDNGDLKTIREYESVSDAVSSVQDIAIANIADKINDLTRLYYALSLQYNPLYNKDATETIVQSGTIADDHTGDDDRSIKGKTQDLTTNASTGARDGQGLDSATVTEDASKVPYNNVNHYDTDRVKTETPVMGSDSNSTNNVDYHDKTDYNSTLTKTYDKTDTHRSYGNLGVTKSTDLLEAEYQIRMQRGFWDYVYHLCLDKQLMRGVVLCE